MGKNRLQTTLAQRQVLTQRMQQAMRLLAMSSLELEKEMREAALANPLLRLDEGDEEDEESQSATLNEAEDRPEEPFAELPAEPDDFAMAWPDRHRLEAEEDDGPDRDIADPRGRGLKAHLLWQIALSRLSDEERRIAEVIIDAIGPNGYLELSLAEIEATLAREGAPVSGVAIETVRQHILQLDPPGCGALSLAECLDAQLLALPPQTQGRALARCLVREHLELLAQGDRRRLARRLKVDEQALEAAIALIRRLDPEPGARFEVEDASYVEPDVLVLRHGRAWRVVLNPERALQLALDPYYTRLAAQAKREDRAYLREQLREARWLIRCVNNRHQTILRVAQVIFERQRGFLDYGPMAMTPLTMREVAAELGIHESTVSRATARKYALTPRGTFELNYFFSQGLETVEGGATSATAVQEMIRAMIAEEDPRRPLSDLALAQALARRGIAVARRTVAKYREAMKIPASHHRLRPS